MARSKHEDDSGQDSPLDASSLEKGAEEQPALQDHALVPDGQKEAFRITWADNDAENPRNFSPWKKRWILIQTALLAFVGSFGSSVISPAQTILASEFSISKDASVLVVTLFVLGYCFGPLLWATVGEVYGRKLSMVPAVFIMGLFSLGSASSQSAAALFITRFLSGLFASAPVSNASASVGDFYSPKDRGYPMAFLAVCVVGGPCIAPIVGSAIVANPHLSWRWTEWVQAIVAFLASIVAAFGLPETYSPVLMKRKAQRLRKETGDNRYWHPQEAEKFQVTTVITKYIARPLRMLTTEPMVTAMATYASYVYGLIFFQLEAFPVVFYEERGYSLIVSSLPFLGLFVGVLCALAINLANQPLYAKAMERNNNRPVPEARCPPMLVGGVLFSTGLFWFGWTSAPHFHWILPTIAAAFIGAGFNIVFQQALNFLADTYGPYAASAMAANTFLRSLLAAGLPLAARPLFRSLGVAPGCSLLGGLSVLALPVPLLFMRYGKRLRGMSKFAPVESD